MKPYSYLLLVVLVIFFSACDRRMYFPERANTPGFTGKNELKATVSAKAQSNYKDSSVTRGSEFSPAVDVAYSFTDHFAVIASYRGITNRYVEPASGWFINNVGGTFNGYRFDVGAGYFSTLGNKGKVEVFGGYGYGQLSRNCDYTPNNFTTHYNRIFVQPAMGFGTDIFTLMGGIRLTGQNFYSFQGVDSNLRYTIASNDGTPAGDVSKQVFFWIEPFVNMEVGYKYAKFNAQVGFSYQLTKGDITGGIPAYISVGGTFYYAPRFFKTRPARVLHTEE